MSSRFIHVVTTGRISRRSPFHFLLEKSIPVLDVMFHRDKSKETQILPVAHTATLISEMPAPRPSTEAQRSYLLLSHNLKQHCFFQHGISEGVSGIGRRRLLSFTEISTVLGLSLSIFSGFVHTWCDLRDYSSDAEEVMEGTKCDLVLHGTKVSSQTGSWGDWTDFKETPWCSSRIEPSICLSFNKGGNCLFQVLTLPAFSFSALKFCFRNREQPHRALNKDGRRLVFGRPQSFF